LVLHPSFTLHTRVKVNSGLEELVQNHFTPTSVEVMEGILGNGLLLQLVGPVVEILLLISLPRIEKVTL
jgi:hypothetical protein